MIFSQVSFQHRESVWSIRVPVTSAEKVPNAYHRPSAVVTPVDVKLVGKDDIARKHRHVAKSTPASITAKTDAEADDQ